MPGGHPGGLPRSGGSLRRAEVSTGALPPQGDLGPARDRGRGGRVPHVPGKGAREGGSPEACLPRRLPSADGRGETGGPAPGLPRRGRHRSVGGGGGERRFHGSEDDLRFREFPVHRGHRTGCGGGPGFCRRTARCLRAQGAASRQCHLQHREVPGWRPSPCSGLFRGGGQPVRVPLGAGSGPVPAPGGVRVPDRTGRCGSGAHGRSFAGGVHPPGRSGEVFRTARPGYRPGWALIPGCRCAGSRRSRARTAGCPPPPGLPRSTAWSRWRRARNLRIAGA